MAKPAEPTFEQLASEYSRLWTSMKIRPAKRADIEGTAKRIASQKARYQEVAAETGVPWFVIGTIHAMECGLNFNRHLHCGDPLTARTRRVPKGRPLAPPKNGKVYTFEESCCDALLLKNLDEIGDWSVERICYELERYNGWGYRWYHPKTLSAYLWSGSQHYTSGKYVEDSKWSESAVSGQSGAMPIILVLAANDKSIILFSQHDNAEPERPPVGQWETDTHEFPKADGDGEEMVNAPSQIAPQPAQVAPETADEAPGGWFAARNFTTLNNLVDQGSTTARSIKTGKDAMQGLGHGSWVAATAAFFSGKTGAILLIAAVVGVIALIVWWMLKRAEKGIVTASRQARYQTRGA